MDLMTHSAVSIQNHRVSLRSINSSNSVFITLFADAQTISDGSTDNRLIVDDGEFSKGLVYFGDYSANFSTYSLVSKGYVDDKQQYVNNGLTFSSGYIGLGGTLSGPVIIDGYDNNVFFSDIRRFSVTASVFITNQVYSLSTNTSVQFNDGDNYYTRVDDASGTYSTVYITPGLLNIYADGGVGKAGMSFHTQDEAVLDGSTNNRIIVTDDVSQKGIVYRDDYTANFTTYSLVTKGYVDSKKPYKVYTALLSQSGTASPTSLELENTLGYSPIFSYSSTGYYELSVPNPMVSMVLFTSGKTFIVNGCPDQGPIGGNFGIFITEYLNTTTIRLSTMDDNGSVYDGMLNNTSIEIRVYP